MNPKDWLRYPVPPSILAEIAKYREEGVINDRGVKELIEWSIARHVSAVRIVESGSQPSKRLVKT